jgi:hypothetical protein
MFCFNLKRNKNIIIKIRVSIGVSNIIEFHQYVLVFEKMKERIVENEKCSKQITGE